MKKSTAVTLVLSGSLLVGCGRRDQYGAFESDTVITNNTFIPGHGYYHAGYGSWYPYPHNYYRPGSGYYFAGAWSPTPDSTVVRASSPSAVRGGSATAQSAGSGSSSVSRGGFGFHGSSSSS